MKTTGARRVRNKNNACSSPAAALALRPIAYCITVAFCSAAHANPTGPQVAAGAATFQTAGKQLNVTNAPGTVISWQAFSIGSGEHTRFLQQSAASAVLNRVVGADASSILGTLSSNGRVLLINPHGIVFGAGSVIDTAGFIASTLNMSDRDFLAGKLKFEGGGNGVLRNEGTIKASGDIMLVGPKVENAGLIRSEAGSVVLAAGKSVTITSPDAQGVKFAVQAPSDSALNLGRIEAKNAVGMFAGTLKHSGDIRVASASVDSSGRVILSAQKDATVESGAKIATNGARGGDVTVQSGDTTLVAGTIEAMGSEAHGGNVQVLGNLVGVIEKARIDVSGETGGGSIVIGGDYQGKNPDVQNAWRTYVAPEVKLSADAIAAGDGGKVIVWADDITRYNGSISARGGQQSGNGGFVEVSGKRLLEFKGTVDTRAPHGKAGTLLLDPNDVNIVAADNPGTDDIPFDPVARRFEGRTDETNTEIPRATLVTMLQGGNVEIKTNPAANPDDGGDINFDAAFNFNTIGAERTLTLNAARDVNIRNDISDSAPDAVDRLNITFNTGRRTDLMANVSLGGGIFNAAGTPGTNLVRINNIDNASVAGTFNVGELVVMDTGKLALNGVVNAATINVSGGILELPLASAVNVTSALNLSGGGILEVRGGQLPRLTMSGGELRSNAANLTIGGPLTLSGGTVRAIEPSNPGNFVTSGITNVSNAVTVARHWTNTGTGAITVSNSAGDGLVLPGVNFVNDTNATLTVNATGRITHQSIATFTNRGTVELAGQLTPQDITNEAVGTFNFNGNGGLTNLTSFNNQGTVNLRLNNNQTPFGPQPVGSITNTGTINKELVGVVTIEPPLDNQAGGGINVDQGTLGLSFSGGSQAGALEIDEGAVLTTINGALTNNGTIGGTGRLNLGNNSNLTLENNGNLRPGNLSGNPAVRGTGTLTIAGNLVNSGTVNLKFAGTADGQFDVIDVIGTVTLGGNLNLSLIGGFTPATGDAVTVISSNQRLANSQFSLISGSSSANLPVYDALGLALASGTSGDLNSWIVNNSGDWGVADNWSLGVPTAGHRVLLDRPRDIYTITIGNGQSFNIERLKSNENLTLFGGLGVANPSTINRTLSISAANAILQGPVSVLTTNGVLDWRSGTIGGGGVFTTGVGTTVFLNGVDPPNDPTLVGKTWDNFGAVTFGGDRRLGLTNSSTINNQNAGSWTLTSGQANPISGTGTFNNFGTFTKNGAAANDLTLTSFNNSGQLNVDSGTLTLRGASATDTGPMFVQDGATLQFSASRTLGAGANVSGVGTVRYSGGTVVLAGGGNHFGGNSVIDTAGAIVQANDNVIFSKLVQSDGELSGAGTIATNAFDWTGGTITGSGTLTTAGQTNISNSVAINGRTWNNAGTVNQSGASSRIGLGANTIINNLAGIGSLLPGQWNISADDPTPLAGNAGTFNNAGILTNGGATPHSLAVGSFSNTGRLNVLSGTLSTSAFANNTNSGTIEINSGAILATNGLGLTNAATGTIAGAGTLNLGAETLANSGNVRPGSLSDDSTGTLNITGNFTNTSQGTLHIRLGGSPASGSFDVLAVSGTANLNGTLNVSTIGAYTAPANDSFTVLTAPTRVGTFATVIPPVGKSVAPAYNSPSPAALVLTTGQPVNLNRWMVDGDGFWNQAIRWSLDHVPLASEPVLIDRPGTITVTVPTGTFNANSLSSAENVTLANGASLTLAAASTIGGTLTISPTATLTRSGNITVNGPLAWSGGAVTGAGTLITTNANNTVTGPVTLGGGEWNNSGTVNQTGTSSIALVGTATINNQGGGIWNQQDTSIVTMAGTSTINNQAGANWNLISTNPNPIDGRDTNNPANVTGTFNNTGTFTKSGAGVQELSLAAFNNATNNSSQLNVTAGTLTLRGTSLGAVESGDIAVSNATLRFAGTRSLGAGSDVTGSGSVAFAAGGLVTVNGGYSIAATGTTSVQGGIVNFENPLSFANVFTVSGGTIGGSGAITTNGPFNWFAGSIGSNANALLTTNGTTAISGGSAGNLVLNGRTWNNEGTVNQTGPSRVTLAGSAIINNQATKTWDIESQDATPIAGVGTFNNRGVFNKAANSLPQQTIPVTFNNLGNQGTVNINAGRLRLSGNGADTGTYNVGTRTLEIAGGIRSYAGPSLSGTSAGTILVTGGVFNLNAGYTQSNNGLAFDVRGGSLGLNGNNTFNGTFRWSGGEVTGTGSLTTTTSSTTAITGAVNLTALPWTNRGTVNQMDSGRIVLANSTITNTGAAANWNLSSTDANPIAGSGTFNNAGGTFTNSGTTAHDLTVATFTNSGTLNVTGNSLAAGLTANSGTIDIAAGSVLSTKGAALTNTGTIRGAGTLDLRAGGAITNDTTLNNSGILRPGTIGGDETGTLAIAGNLSQGGGGLIEVQLGGTAAGQFDVVSVSGTAQLAGTLNLTTTDGYAATDTDAFMVLTSSSRMGTFSITKAFAPQVTPIYNPSTVVVAIGSGTVNKWNADVSDSWNNVARWTLGHIPTATEQVRIERPNSVVTVEVPAGTFGANALTSTENLTLIGTLGLNNDSIISGTLAIAGGSLNANAQMAVNGPLNWSSGTVSGTGTLTTNGPTNVTGTVNLLDKAWDNFGGLGITQSGQIVLAGASAAEKALTNKTGGIITVTSSSPTPVLTGAGATNKRFTNEGTLNKNVGSAEIQTLNLPFTNTNPGLVNVNAGRLVLNAASSGMSDTGDFAVAQNSTLQFNGSRTLGAGADLSGNGNATVTAGTLRLDGTAKTIAPAMVIDGGTIDAAVTAGFGALTLTSGALTGAGAVTTGAFGWSSGTISGGGMLTTNGTTNVVSSTPGTMTLDGRRWNNAGSVSQTDASQITLLNSAMIDNTGTWNVGSSTLEALTGLTGRFNNSGTFTSSAAPHDLTIGTFTNTGPLAVALAAGTLTLRDGVGTDTGAMSVAAGGALRFLGNRTLGTGANVSGSGETRFSGGTVTLSGGNTIAGSAIIEGGTVNATSGITFNALSQFGGTLSGAGAVIIDGNFNWTGGAIAGPNGSMLTTNGTTVLTDSSFGSVGVVTLDGRTWNNTASVSQTGTSRLNLLNSAVINNRQNATWGVGSSQVNAIDGAGTFNNAGTFGNNATSHNLTLAAFNNTGLVNVNANTGTLTLNSASPGATDTGDIAVFSGSAIQFAGSRTLTTGADITGAGNVRFSGGTVALTGDNKTISSPTFIDGGTVNTSAPVVFNSLALTTGTLAGSGSVTAGALNWSAGTVSGSGALVTTGTTTITDPTTAGLESVTLDGRQWNSGGPVTVTGTRQVTLANGAVISNFGGWTLATTNPNPLTGVGTFNNSATFTKDGSDAQSLAITAFNNNGQVNVNAGTLTLNAASGPLTDSGDIAIAANSTLQFSGSRKLGAGADITGPGAVRFSFGTVEVNDVYSIAATGRTTIDGGTATFNTAASTVEFANPLTISNSGTLTGTDGFGTTALEWSGGTITLAGTTLTTGGISNVTGAVALNGGTWHNSGTVNQTGPSRISVTGGAVINNQATRAWNLSSDHVNPLDGAVTFNNSGTFTNAGPTAHNLSITSFTNPGQLNVTGGTFASAAFPTNTGGIEVSAGAELSTNGGAFTNAATGVFKGNGRANLAGATFTNSGLLEPGASPGSLTIAGNFTQTSASPGVAPGRLTIELGGTTQGVSYDVLRIDGTANLGGILNVALVAPFTGVAGNTYDFMTYASRNGNFSTFNFPQGPTFVVVPGPAMYRLAQISPPESGRPPNVEVMAMSAREILVLTDRNPTDRGPGLPEGDKKKKESEGSVQECR